MGITIISLTKGKADCFLIKIEEEGKYFNLLVDCGEKNLYDAIKNELEDSKLNGVVITHIDSDHLIGMFDLLDHEDQDIFSKNTFFIYNKYDESLISYEQGRKLYEKVKEKFGQKLLIKSYAGNYHRENKILKRRTKDDNLYVQVLSKRQRSLRDRDQLENNTVYLTMLSPDIRILKKFMQNYETDYDDSKITNKSSVVFLMEFRENSLLMLGDAYVPEACKDLERLIGLKRIDFIKISHHGAKENNKGLAGIVEKYHCKIAAVTIPVKINPRQTHPSRDLIMDLEDKKCQIYTSTDYVCEEEYDLTGHVIYREEALTL